MRSNPVGPQLPHDGGVDVEHRVGLKQLVGGEQRPIHQLVEKGGRRLRATDSRQTGTVLSRHCDLRRLFSSLVKQKTDNNSWYLIGAAPMAPHPGAIAAVSLRFP